MVYISKVYTKSGDGGQTMLADGTLVDKDTQRIRAYGDVDELGACIGLVRLEIEREPRKQGADIFIEEFDRQLARIQQELFNLGAELATPLSGDEPPKLHVDDAMVERIETEIDAWNADLQPLRSFILAAGGPVGTSCHLARTVCRRAEREVIALSHGEKVRPEAIRYLNRLSDALFVMARAIAHRLGYPETLWDPQNL